jgi:hypothetical protein
MDTAYGTAGSPFGGDVYMNSTFGAPTNCLWITSGTHVAGSIHGTSGDDCLVIWDGNVGDIHLNEGDDSKFKNSFIFFWS